MYLSDQWCGVKFLFYAHLRKRQLAFHMYGALCDVDACTVHTVLCAQLANSTLSHRPSHRTRCDFQLGSRIASNMGHFTCMPLCVVLAFICVRPTGKAYVRCGCTTLCALYYVFANSLTRGGPATYTCVSTSTHSSEQYFWRIQVIDICVYDVMRCFALISVLSHRFAWFYKHRSYHPCFTA